MRSATVLEFTAVVSREEEGTEVLTWTIGRAVEAQTPKFRTYISSVQDLKLSLNTKVGPLIGLDFSKSTGGDCQMI